MFSFSIQYQTAEIIPPPFAYAIEVSGKSDGGGNVDINFSLEYLGREELTETEILEEGFTLHDDFAWKGQLPTVWLDVLFGTLKTTQATNQTEINEDQDFWQISFEGKKMYPKHSENWKVLLQELQQAIYEKAEYENTLAISYVSVTEKGKEKIKLEASFVTREAFFSYPLSRQANRRIDWADLAKMLQNIYSLDFVQEAATDKSPYKKGEYVNLGDDFWFEIGVSVKGNKKEIQKLRAVFG